MRTTVTLDPDVEELVRRRMRERGVSFTKAINDLVRDGAVVASERRPFRTETASLGNLSVDLDRALQIAVDLEDDELTDALKPVREAGRHERPAPRSQRRHTAARALEARPDRTLRAMPRPHRAGSRLLASFSLDRLQKLSETAAGPARHRGLAGDATAALLSERLRDVAR
jgi:hypothetical protein